MAAYNVTRITPSKYGNGDRWRFEIEGEWYDAYLSQAAAEITAGDHDIEWKTSQKTGKHFIVAVDGRYRTTQQAASPPTPPPASGAPAPRAHVASAASGGPAPSQPHQRDMWIFAAGLANHIIGAMGPHDYGDDELASLARRCALAARAAARVFDGAGVDQARAAIATPAAPPPRAAPPRPAHPPQPAGDPDDPRNFGSDPGEPVGGAPFDDDIPFS
jgi:hypothetical protein